MLVYNTEETNKALLISSLVIYESLLLLLLHATEPYWLLVTLWVILTLDPHLILQHTPLISASSRREITLEVSEAGQSHGSVFGGLGASDSLISTFS